MSVSDTGGSDDHASQPHEASGGPEPSGTNKPTVDSVAEPSSAAPLKSDKANGSSVDSAEKPKIGDSRPGRVAGDAGDAKKNGSVAAESGADGSRADGNGAEGSGAEGSGAGEGTSAASKRRRRRRRSNKSRAESGQGGSGQGGSQGGGGQGGSGQGGRGRTGQGGRSQAETGSNRRQGGGRKPQPIEHVIADGPIELDESEMKRRRGKTRKGRPVGRYMMVASRRPDATHIAILEGRNLIEYYVSRPSDDVAQIHGNIYVGRVQNVLPGMEAAFVDIGTPKNAVLYRGDIVYDKSNQPKNAERPKIESLLKAKQTMICQVTKNPIAHKGARLTTEVSLPGRFVVLVPNSDTYGISKRLPDTERKRLRQILDKSKPKHHGVIVRTAAENVTSEEIVRDVAGLVQQWEQIEALAARANGAQLLYREPDMSVRVIREEFNKEYRAVVIDDEALYNEVSDYVSVISPALAERVEFFDAEDEGMHVMDRFHVHEQLHKALDRKVWLPSGGSLIIESTEALTVIDVNTGKNVGSSSLEETVYRNNLEAAEEVARQLRLRDIGGIIVIDFVDMEDRKNREETMRVFRNALSRDKTRTQVFDIGELGLAEMTRKRIGEGLLESLSSRCPNCDGRGMVIDGVPSPK